MNGYSDTYTLNNGMELPCMLFGTYNPGDIDSLTLIEQAIANEYRYFDTASFYETERALGEAMKKSGIPREEFFITSKLWIDERGGQNVKEALERSLMRIGTDHIDLYLIHWPHAAKNDEEWNKKNIETWKAMEDLCREGKICEIGLSNFHPHHIEGIIKNAEIMPVIDQLELHPGYMQEYTLTYLREHDIFPQAWSPLGRARLLSDPVILELARKYKRSSAQICLRYLLQRGVSVVVKSASPARMRENQNVFDFELSFEDMSLLSCMAQAGWSGEHPDSNAPDIKSNFEQ